MSQFDNADPSVAEPSVAEPSVAEPSVAEPSVDRRRPSSPFLCGDLYRPLRLHAKHGENSPETNRRTIR